MIEAHKRGSRYESILSAMRGKQNDDAVFCGNCGARLSQKQTPCFEEPKKAVSIQSGRKSSGFPKIILMAVILVVVIIGVGYIASKPSAKDEVNYSTTTNGDLNDFDWYFNTGMILDGEKLTTLNGVDGGWKVLVDYTPLMYELGNIAFTGTQKDIEAALVYSSHYNLSDDSYTMQNGGALYFSGKFRNGKIIVSGGGWTFEIDKFCTIGNKQYGIGQLKGAEGSKYNVALFRP